VRDGRYRVPHTNAHRSITVAGRPFHVGIRDRGSPRQDC
jgi:hypothetical protein